MDRELQDKVRGDYSRLKALEHDIKVSRVFVRKRDPVYERMLDKILRVLESLNYGQFKK